MASLCPPTPDFFPPNLDPVLKVWAFSGVLQITSVLPDQGVWASLTPPLMAPVELSPLLCALSPPIGSPTHIIRPLGFYPQASGSDVPEPLHLATQVIF